MPILTNGDNSLDLGHKTTLQTQLFFTYTVQYKSLGVLSKYAKRIKSHPLFEVYKKIFKSYIVILGMNWQEATVRISVTVP